MPPSLQEKIQADVQSALHTDSLRESLSSDTVEAMKINLSGSSIYRVNLPFCGPANPTLVFPDSYPFLPPTFIAENLAGQQITFLIDWWPASKAGECEKLKAGISRVLFRDQPKTKDNEEDQKKEEEKGDEEMGENGKGEEIGEEKEGEKEEKKRRKRGGKRGKRGEKRRKRGEKRRKRGEKTKKNERKKKKKRRKKKKKRRKKKKKRRKKRRKKRKKKRKKKRRKKKRESFKFGMAHNLVIVTLRMELLQSKLGGSLFLQIRKPVLKRT